MTGESIGCQTTCANVFEGKKPTKPIVRRGLESRSFCALLEKVIVLFTPDSVQDPAAPNRQVVCLAVPAFASAGIAECESQRLELQGGAG